MLSKRALIYAAVVILVLAGAAIYIFVIAQLHIPPEEKAERARLAQHLIYYECKRDANISNENYDICAVNADGSNMHKVMSSEGTQTTFGSLVINKKNEIVFHCEYIEQGIGGVQHNICAITDEDQEPVKLNFPRNGARSDLIGLNESGQVVTTCGALLCITEIGAEGYAEIPNSDGNGLAIGPDVNNLGQIVYSCWITTPPRAREICAIEADGSGFRVLSDSGEGRAFNPRFIDESRVIYNCGDELDAYNICEINYDGSGYEQLTSFEGREDALNPAVNVDLGVVVYECWRDVQHAHLCAMNLDGSEQHQITPEPESDGPFQYINPSASDDGLIAFGCGKQLCVINLDGTGMHQLTGGSFSDYGARRPVVYER